jgi:hypothetical protein
MNGLIDYVDIALMMYGFLTLMLIFTKPAWFWDSVRMQQRRAIMGDTKTSYMYYGMSAVMLIVAIASRMGFFN